MISDVPFMVQLGLWKPEVIYSKMKLSESHCQAMLVSAMLWSVCLGQVTTECQAFVCQILRGLKELGGMGMSKGGSIVRISCAIELYWNKDPFEQCQEENMSIVTTTQYVWRLE